MSMSIWVSVGHPEGETFPGFAALIESRQRGKAMDAELSLPTAADGLRGVPFLKAAITSSRKDGAWVSLPAESS